MLAELAGNKSAMLMLRELGIISAKQLAISKQVDAKKALPLEELPDLLTSANLGPNSIDKILTLVLA